MDPYTGVIAWNNAEGGTNGSAVTTGGTGSGTAWSAAQITGSSSLTYSSSVPLQDAMSYLCVVNGGFSQVRWGEAVIGTVANACGVLYVDFSSLPTTYTPIAGGYTDDTGTQRTWIIKVSSTGNIRLSDTADTTVASGTTPITANKGGRGWRIEWQVNQSTGAYTVEWFDGDSTTRTGFITGTHASGGSGFGATGSTKHVRWFGISSSVAFTARFDTIAFNSTKLGPRAVANVAPTANAGADKTNGQVGVQVTQTGTDSDVDGSVSVREWTCMAYPPGSSAPALFGATTATVSFTPAAAGLYVLSYRVQDNSNAWSASSTVNVYVPGTSIVPIGLTSNAGAWSNQGGASDFAAALRDGQATTYLQSNASLASPSTVRIRLAPLAVPSVFTLNPSLLLSAAGSGTALVRLYEGTTMRKEWSVSPTISVSTPDLTLTSGEIASITSWLALDIEFSWSA